MARDDVAGDATTPKTSGAVRRSKGHGPPDEVAASVLMHAAGAFGRPVEDDMSANRDSKVAVVDAVRTKLEASSAAVVTEYRGLTVAEMAALRRALRAVGGDYKVYKNTLVRRAVADGSLAPMEELLVGPTAIAFVSGDVSAVAKALRDFARGAPALIVKGGVLDGALLGARDLAALADLPSREVLLSQFAGALAAPMRTIAGLLKALPQNLAYGLSALLDQRGGAPVEDVAATESTDVADGAAEAAPEGSNDSEDAQAEQVDAAEGDEVPTAEPSAEGAEVGAAPDADAGSASESAGDEVPEGAPDEDRA